MAFVRPEHQIIAGLLAGIDGRFLLESRCWFAGGTAIVLKLGEYRRSLDIDFLCADIGGYRRMRELLSGTNATALFPDGVSFVREPRADAYGIRLFLDYQGLAVKFEIVREGRIDLDGAMDEDLRVPLLGVRDLFAEKLLANADRCMDRSVAYRDAVDLGRLIEAHGNISDDALAKALAAYGGDIERKAVWVVNHLASPEERRYCAAALQMDGHVLRSAVEAFGSECRRLWPQAMATAGISSLN